MPSDQARDSKPAAAWRLSPEKNFADCTVIVKSISTGGGGGAASSSSHQALKRQKTGEAVETLKTDIYRVHKLFLAAHPRPCEYFSGIMHSKNFREGETNITEVTVHESVARVFPDFLDFLYTGELEVDKDSILALRWLAKYFGNSSLLARLEEYTPSFEPDLDDFLPLYEQAKVMHDEAFFDVLASHFGRFLMKPVSNERLEKLKARLSQDFLRAVLPKASPYPVTSVYVRKEYRLFQYVHDLLSHFFHDKPQEGLQLWRQLTSTEKLPSFGGAEDTQSSSIFVALVLLESETALVKAAGELNDGATELQSRCLEFFEVQASTFDEDLFWDRWESGVDRILEWEPPSEVVRGLHRSTVRFARAERAQRLRLDVMAKVSRSVESAVKRAQARAERDVNLSGRSTRR